MRYGNFYEDTGVSTVVSVVAELFFRQTVCNKY